MKLVKILTCTMIMATVIMGGCSNQNTNATIESDLDQKISEAVAEALESRQMEEIATKAEESSKIVEEESETNLSSTALDDTYVIPVSNSKILSMEELGDFTSEGLRFARNEIYARHGRTFENPALKEFFETKTWYKPLIDAEQWDDTVLNSYEKHNIEIISTYEQEMVDFQSRLNEMGINYQIITVLDSQYAFEQYLQYTEDSFDEAEYYPDNGYTTETYENSIQQTQASGPSYKRNSDGGYATYSFSGAIFGSGERLSNGNYLYEVINFENGGGYVECPVDIIMSMGDAIVSGAYYDETSGYYFVGNGWRDGNTMYLSN